MNFKCNKCQKIDSTHVKNRNISILAMAYGPKDFDGRQQYYIYCKDCQVVNVYKPYMLGIKKKFDRFREDIPSLIVELASLEGGEAAPAPKVIVKGLANEMIQHLRNAINHPSK